MALNQPVTKPAVGDSAQTGMPKNLAPTRPAKIPGPDIVSTPRQEQNVGSRYGMNNFAGRSSTSPGEEVHSPLSESIRSASEKGSDPVLAALIEKGSAAMDVVGDEVITAVEGQLGSQLRDIREGNKTPDSWGMDSSRRRQNSTHSALAAKVPANNRPSWAPSPAAAIRKPGT